ncbi:hypothetical protein M3Y97_00337400 [Aphelenchoides bicaudatus]|nr:hypothetical protein M3Y97_00337400 [Aphelenchoides bicaudatus]
MNFNIPLFLTPLNSGPNEPTVIGTYESNKKAVPVNGLQDYDALIWIEDGEEWKICKRSCKVSFFQRADNVLYAKYTDAASKEVIFQQAIYKGHLMDLKKDYFLADFLKAESLDTDDDYHLIVVFCDKQKYDRAVSWYRQGDRRPS